MKIGILTFHRAENYGAVLQAYALCEVLRQCSHLPEVIDFRAKSIEDEYQLLSTNGSTMLQRMKRLLGSVLRYPTHKKRKRYFNAFVRQHLPVSMPIYKEDIVKLADTYDAYITGSDQVFNTDITKNDAGAYTLDFVSNPHKKYSYAASFGKTSLTETECSIFKDYLKDFEQISVREQSGVNLVKDILGREALVHLDPTLLLTREQWTSLCSANTVNGEFILLYVILPLDWIYGYTEQLSMRFRIPVICLNGSLKQRLQYRRFRYVDDASPAMFLSLFNNAAYVVTSSFHGTVFSLQFRKQFITMLPEKNERNDRMRSLLEKLNLSERMVVQRDCISDIGASIDWNGIEASLDCERKRSMEYICQIGDKVQ